MNAIISEVSLSFLLNKDPKTPVNEAVPFMVDTRRSETERVLPYGISDIDIPSWIKNPKPQCLRFTLVKNEENSIFKDTECTYSTYKSSPVLTFNGIKYNEDNTSKYVNDVFDILCTEQKPESNVITRYKAVAKFNISVPLDKDMLADVITNHHKLSDFMALCEKTSTLGERRLFSVAVSLDEEKEKEIYARVALAGGKDGTEIVAMMSKLPTEESSSHVADAIKCALDTYEDSYLQIYGDAYSDEEEGSYASSIAEGIKQLRRELPELFVNNYTRECPVLPIMVSVEEAQALQAQGTSVIMYPKEMSKYTRYYTAPRGCYVGLKKNRLSNRTIFPCLVTCYLLDHMKREGSETYKYYNDTDETNKKHKTLQQKARPVPKSITLSYENYYRNKADSFISALERAIGIKKLDKLPWFPQITKQELWDKSDDKTMKIIQNGSCNGYGALVYRYFEELLEISIHVVVIRDGKFESLIPRHKHVYIWQPPYADRHIVIFETFKTTYGKTHCSYEYLIGKIDGNKNIEQTIFPQDDTMVNSIIMQKYSESIRPPIVENIYVEQLIDNWGKCREVTAFDGSKIRTHTRPIATRVAPDPTCFFDLHIRKMNDVRQQIGLEPLDLSKRSTTKILYFPNNNSFWYWVNNNNKL
jgi:hypothetical protein